mgnify:CR=1 FL=1
MGRIKSLMIKRAARQLMAGVDSFSGDFDTNKKLLKNTMQYKSTRNKVAGYISRVKKKQKSEK